MRVEELESRKNKSKSKTKINNYKKYEQREYPTEVLESIYENNNIWKSNTEEDELEDYPIIINKVSMKINKVKSNVI